MKSVKKIIQEVNSGIIDETRRVLIGWREIRKLQKKYGEETQIIFLRGATGDTYLQLLLLEEYIKQNNIKKYVLAGDAGGIGGLMSLFAISEYIFFSVDVAECIEKAYLFLDGNNINMRFFFIWTNGYKHNACRVRLTERFNFMDSYQYFSFGLSEPITMRKPHFIEPYENDYYRWQKQGIIKGKTVVISPDANSVTRLPIWFWNSIIISLKENGFAVFMNCNYYSFYRATDIFFSYGESVPFLEYAGYFIGLRSGLCDIISSAKCKKVIIYPMKQSEVDYSEHRTEKEFSSLSLMGLAEESDDLKEIDTPLIRNITDENTLLEGTENYANALMVLRREILKAVMEE